MGKPSSVANVTRAICSDLLSVAGELVSIAYPDDDTLKKLLRQKLG